MGGRREKEGRGGGQRGAKAARRDGEGKGWGGCVNGM